MPLSKPPEFIREEAATRGENRVGRYLSRHDAPCPQCGYNLHAMEGSACPECGGVISEQVLWPDRYKRLLYTAAGMYLTGCGLLIGLCMWGAASISSGAGWRYAAPRMAISEALWERLVFQCFTPLLLGLLDGYLGSCLLKRDGRERFRALAGDQRTGRVVRALFVVMTTVAGGVAALTGVGVR